MRIKKKIEAQKTLKFSELLFPNNLRPNCPRCGSTKIESRGDSWSCNECHRRWLKSINNEVKERIKQKKEGKKYDKEKRID